MAAQQGGDAQGAAEEQDLQPGQRLGDYEVVRKLGGGAFGAVYEALRMPLKKRVALKVLHREYVRHRDVVDRFLREAEIVAQIDHPHIVGAFDVGVIEGAPFLAMEFLDGESLASLLQRGGALPLQQAIGLTLPLLSAMATVHDKGIVHRDLKPDNIFIARLATGETRPKLLDFGIAKVRDAEKALTRTNAILGTPYYMSPEQANESKRVDAKADQWSLAVILFECLTGKRPFEGDSLLALLTAITTGPIPRLRAQRADLPEGLEAVLLRAMDRTPDARWPSARAFGAALVPYASPAGQEQWRPFFLDPASLDTTLSANKPVGSSQPKPEELAATGLQTPRTLEPATRDSLVGGQPRRRGAAIMLGGLALAALGAASALYAHTPEHTEGPRAVSVTTPRAFAARPASVAPQRSPAPQPDPAPTVTPAAAVPAVAAVSPAATPAAPAPAAQVVADGNEARSAPREARRHHRRRHEAGNAPTPVGVSAPSTVQPCPNGICAPE